MGSAADLAKGSVAGSAAALVAGSAGEVEAETVVGSGVDPAATRAAARVADLVIGWVVG